MNIKRSRITAVMAIIVSLLALFASLFGIVNKNLYTDLLKTEAITNFLVVASIAQDIISIPLALILAALSISFLKCPGHKTFISMLGIIGYFFYGYGLYVMQGQYTSIYHVYLAIFGLSLYSLIFGLLSFERNEVEQFHLSGTMRKSISAFLILILIVLVPLWLILSYGNVAKHVPSDTYAVFILDLCIVFPTFGIITTQLLRNKPFGNILAGVALLKALTVCLSVAFGELFQAFYGGYAPNYDMIAIFAMLTTISLVLFILYMFKLKKEELSNG